MRSDWFRIFSMLAIIGLVFGCSGEKSTTGTQTTTDFLTEKVNDVSRSSEVSLYEGQSLWEYIDGGAEVYHQYGFVEVATAYYKLGEAEITADIYLFDSPAHAFGLLSTLMPPEPQLVEFGALGFKSPTSIDFIKGPYLVRLTGYDESEQTGSAIQTLAESLAVRVPGTAELPAELTSFPDSGRVAASEKLLARSYLGQAFLTEVYAVDYTLDGDRFTLFMSDDTSGEKFLQWSAAVGDRAGIAEGLPYDGGRSFKTVNSYYGEIVAGLKAGRLMGVVGYTGRLQGFVTDWLNSQH